MDNESDATINLSQQPSLADERFTVMLDTTPQFTKPTRWAKINTRLSKGACKVTLPELSDYLVQKKYTFCPSYFTDTRKNENWKSQQIFGIDIDTGLTPEALLIRCRLFNIHPAILYSTLSDRPAERKFRALFVVQGKVTEEFYRKLTVGMLQSIFPECDQACKDANRLFLGGKELLHTDYEARLHPMQLSNAFHAHLRANDKHRNYQRRLEAASKAWGVAIEGNHLAISELGQNDANAASAYIYKEMPQMRHFWVETTQTFAFPKLTHSTLSNSSTQSRTACRKPAPQEPDAAREASLPRLSTAKKQTLLDGCRLLHEFHDATGPVKHDHLFTIANNLFKFNGGKSWFFEMLDKLINAGHEVPGKQDSFNSAVHSLYSYKFTKSCDAAQCPYLATCRRKGRTIKDQLGLAKGEVRQVGTPPRLKTLDETRAELRQALLQACNSPGNDVWVIKVDTGVGKTEELLKLPLKNTFVGFPTHRLCQQAYDRLKKMGSSNTPFLWKARPQLPPEFESEAKLLELLCLPGIAELVRKARDEAEAGNIDFVNQCNDYLTSLRKVNEASFVFGTHDKGFILNNPKIKTFILDEDVANSMIKYFQIDSQDVSRLLKKLKDSGENELQPVVDLLRQADACGSQTPISNTQVIPDSVYKKIVHRYCKSLSSPVAQLLNCDAFIRDSQGNGIVAVKKIQLKSDVKYIILSATADERVCRHLLGDRLRFVDIGGTAIAGELLLDNRRTFSKTSIDAGYDNFKNHVVESVARNGLDGIITYKKYTEEVEGRQVLRGTEVPVLAWFHATEGLDDFRGKSIGVFGTPFPPESVYILMAYALAGGAGVADGLSFAERQVEWKGWRFRLRSCAEPGSLLEHVQLWLVESELVQAVGRARLVQEAGARVQLCGAMPIGQVKKVFPEKPSRALLVQDAVHFLQ